MMDMLKSSYFGCLCILCCAVACVVLTVATAQDVSPNPSVAPSDLMLPGDRVTCVIHDLEGWIPAILTTGDYRIGAGDTLRINVQGKASLGYKANPDVGRDADPNEVVVSPGGDIYLPLVGKVLVAGKTVSEIEQLIRTELSKYIKEFEVFVSVSKVRTVNVWLSGEVVNPGPRALPAVSTVSLAVLQAGVKPTGSTRRITLVQGKKKETIDLFKMMLTGDVGGDVPLEPGGVIHVPAVTKYVEVIGEVTRPGRYEMIGLSGGDDFRVRDLLKLSRGVLPSGALDKCFIERIGESGNKEAIACNLGTPEGLDMLLESGDVLVVPSVSAYQPMIRLIGEFKGEGVYQRMPGGTATDVENKSGIYFLKQGQTVRDVITATGGVTPQADLKRAYIQRKDESGHITTIPLDLERLLIHGDVSVDVRLVNGDSLVVPAVADRVYVFGDVKSPGSFVYSPKRRLVDYLGDAGGPTDRARLSSVSVVRGTLESPTILRFDVKSAIRGTSTEENPELEPGDIVYVPSKIVSGWRDALQLMFTSVSLMSLVSRL